MADKPVNENILEQLKYGIAKFELVSSPVASISTLKAYTCPTPYFADNTSRFFARIAPSLGGGSPAMRKVEHYSVQKITGDGRCLFRALAKGMAFNKGISLNPHEERNDADDLRMAVKQVICDSNKERQQYEEALIAITVDESLKRYCQRILRPDFWGGESELLTGRTKIFITMKIKVNKAALHMEIMDGHEQSWFGGFIHPHRYPSLAWGFNF